MPAIQHANVSQPMDVLTANRKQCFSPREKSENNVAMKGRPITVANTETLESLAVRVAENRDKHAFRLLFAHFAPRIKSFLLKQKVSNVVAEDLTQEVMVTVWQKAHLYDPQKARLSTWLFRIARNKFIDKVRRQKYIEVDVDDHVQSMEASEKTDIPVIQMQDRSRIMNALDALKPDLRTVIELSFYQDLSHSQISEQLGLPLGTVKSRIRIAFQKLRVELGEF